MAHRRIGHNIADSSKACGMIATRLRVEIIEAGQCLVGVECRLATPIRPTPRLGEQFKKRTTDFRTQAHTIPTAEKSVNAAHDLTTRARANIIVTASHGLANHNNNRYNAGTLYITPL